MTYEAIDNRQTDTQIVLCQENCATVPSLKLRVQPWLKLSFAVFCLIQAVRLLGFADPIANLMGLGCLSVIPSCLILGLRDYRGLKRATVSNVVRLAKAA